MTNEEYNPDEKLEEKVQDMLQGGNRVKKEKIDIDKILKESVSGLEEEKESEKVKIFEYLTCKNTLHVGLRRLLLVLSFPFFVCWIIPGILFWVIVHAIVWIYEGFVSDDKKPPIQGNNIFSREKN